MRRAAASCWRQKGSTTPAAEPGERGTTLFTGDFALRPGDQQIVTLSYRLPASVPVKPYRLAVRKQAGTLALPLQVEVGGCRWGTDLGVDRVFECQQVP